MPARPVIVNPDVRMRGTATQDRPLTPPLNRRRTALIGIILVLAGLAVAAAPHLRRFVAAAHSIPRDRLRIAEVARGRLVRDVAVRGKVVAGSSRALHSDVAGTVELLVTAGEVVHLDQVVARIESPELANRLASEEALLEATSVALARQRIDSERARRESRQLVELSRVELTAARRELERAEQSQREGLTSRFDLDAARDRVETMTVRHRHASDDLALDGKDAAFELRARELALERQQLVVSDLRRRVDGLSLRAPVDGVIGTLHTDPGAAVTSGQPLLTVVDLSDLQIEIWVPESYADDLSPGLSAEVIVGGATATGTLVSTSPEVREARVAARVRLDDAALQGLRRHQAVEVRLLLEAHDDVVLVRRGPFYDSGGGRVAYVVDGDLARRRDITTGALSIDAIEITDGVSPGERVVLSSLSEFRGADIIRLID